VYWAFVPDGFVAMGTAAVYAGTSYFYFAFDVSLLGEAVRFDDRVDRVGYAIGLFGLSVSPLAFARYFGQESEAMIPLRDLVHGRHRVSALRLARPTPARTRTVIAMPVGSVASSDIGGAVVATGTYRRISAFVGIWLQMRGTGFIHESGGTGHR